MRRSGRQKPTPDKLKGLRGTNQDIYDQLILCGHVGTLGGYHDFNYDESA